MAFTSMDVKGAYLHANLNTSLYVHHLLVSLCLDKKISICSLNWAKYSYKLPRVIGMFALIRLIKRVFLITTAHLIVNTL